MVDNHHTKSYLDINPLGKHNIFHDHTYVSDNVSLKGPAFGFINVNSLKNKLIIPEFIEFVNKYDILACAETKLSILDSIKLEGSIFQYAIGCLIKLEVLAFL